MTVRCRFLLVSLVLLAACSRAGVLPQAASRGEAPAFAASHPLSATIVIRIPNAMIGAAVFPGLMHQAFVAAMTQGALVRLYNHNKDKHPVATIAANLSSKSKACKKTSSGRTCSIVVDIPAAGTYDFSIDTYNKPPKHGKFSAQAKQLAVGTTSEKLAKSRTVKLVLGGIVAATQTAFGIASAPVIDPFSATLTVAARDADGEVIVTDGYVDKNGKPVTLTMKADTNAGTTIIFTPASITKPTTVTLNYGPGSLSNAQATNGFSTIIATAASNGAPATGVTLALNKPAMHFYPTPTGSSTPFAIVTGPDNALWFTENQTTKIGRITTTGAITEFTPSTGGTRPNGITKGPDGNIWFIEQVGNTVNRVTTPPAVDSFTIPTAGAYASNIVTGPDGNLWFTEGAVAKIGRVTPTGIFAEFPVTASGLPQGITVGPDGALWFTECNAQKIGRITTAGGTPTYFTVLPGTHPYSIAAASDGTLWFSGCVPYIYRMTTAGALHPYTLPGDAVGVTRGPDGAIWFGVTASTHYIGRISTAGVLTLYSLPGSNPYPGGITTGPDGAVWFTELNGNQIGRLQ